MNKKILLTLSALFISQVGFAQIEFDDYVSQVGEAMDGTTIYAFQATEIEGNPLLFDEFVRGVLVSGNSQTVPVNLNLDLANNRILVNRGNKLIGIENSAVTAIKILTPTLTFKNGFQTGGKDDLNKYSLFKVIHEGDNVSFLKHTGVNLQKDVSSYSTATQTDVFIQHTAYYVIKDGKFDRVKMRKRNVLRLFDENRKAVDTYAKENKLDFKDDEHLALMFKYAESLALNN